MMAHIKWGSDARTDLADWRKRDQKAQRSGHAGMNLLYETGKPTRWLFSLERSKGYSAYQDEERAGEQTVNLTVSVLCRLGWLQEVILQNQAP